uniref:WGS project CAEQ00000000 data, annotated contig 1734 n=1 Tax=Trypanosoma congolense (strain IL3000) TaxID=1068625 RepID=F9W8G0_TRYCI|nr:unnamed protein product [Trypanosoma congolense IL3000]
MRATEAEWPPPHEPLLGEFKRGEVPLDSAVGSGHRATRKPNSAQVPLGDSGKRGVPTMELQIETLSTSSVLWFLYSWYCVLVVALFLQSAVSLQWKMLNLCDSSSVSVRDLESWTSACVERFGSSFPAVSWHDFEVLKQPYGSVPPALYKTSSPSGRCQQSVLTSLEPCSGNYSAVGDDEWSSQQSLRAQRHFNIRWKGIVDDTMLRNKLVRFVRIVLSLASPQEDIPNDAPFKTYQLLITLKGSPMGVPNEGNSSPHRGVPTSLSEGTYNYTTSTTCFRNSLRCSPVVLPSDVVASGVKSGMVLSLYAVEEELAVVASMSAVGIVYQSASYTVFTVVWRYTFIVISTFHLIFFLHQRHGTQPMYEQRWVTALNVALILYLDPFFIAGTYYTNSEFYRFFEFHVPNYFIAFLSCFIFALVGASIKTSERTRKSAVKEEAAPLTSGGGAEEQSVQGSPSTPASPETLPLQRRESPSAQECEEVALVDEPSMGPSAHGEEQDQVTAPTHRAIPLWATVSIIYYFGVLVGVDVARVSLENREWRAGGDSAAFICHYLRTMFYTMLLVLVAASYIMLIWLQHNLGKQPYLESRPQQLACRVFIFVFTSAMIYFVVQVVIIELLYPHIVRIVAHQPFNQISPVMVSSFFVNHITFVYTPTTSSVRVPLRPNNPQWRLVVWSRQWYRWLHAHGGILYIFHNEKQERQFNWIQCRKKILRIMRRGAAAASVIPATAGVREGSGSGREIEVCGSSGPVKDKWEGDLNRVLFECALGGGDVPSDMGEYLGASGWDVSSDSQCSSEDGSTLSDSSSRDSSSDIDDNGETVRPSRRRKWVRVSKRVMELLGRAERHIVERSAVLLGRLEGAILDPLQSLQLGSDKRVPFFNLETAIDCLNLSWEAYFSVAALPAGLGDSSRNDDVLANCALQNSCIAPGGGVIASGRGSEGPRHDTSLEEPVESGIRALDSGEGVAGGAPECVNEEDVTASAVPPQPAMNTSR